ncbi:uncharacterized protein B0I36DRAFT_322935 [Microdochium trichocladiopsis]|uniref:Uncharacterized protein n=1 Tax=Microdochium trichocladiopsis TaxID=1682393 RepID=A0A9P9BU05_9PEZI|nr:uncharacterized protein B0I36DRAFT_322935 [Microdochium trichocladiopsis]KAH7030979.1 hypothetical protein B0I36DRAFT_322935 [Microdochium trichocladiopsis]
MLCCDVMPTPPHTLYAPSALFPVVRDTLVQITNTSTYTHPFPYAVDITLQNPVTACSCC